MSINEGSREATEAARASIGEAKQQASTKQPDKARDAARKLTKESLRKSAEAHRQGGRRSGA